MRIISIVILLSAFLPSCVGSRYSNKRKGEKLQMNVVQDPTYLKLHELKVQQVPNLAMRGASSRGIAVGQLVSLGIMGVNKLIEIDKGQFTASYGQSLNNLYFYDQISHTGPFDPTGIQFKGFEIKRIAKVHKKDTTAFYASFEVDPTNKYEILNSSVFRLRIKDIKLQYSKAKASDTRWFVPWSWGNKSYNHKMNMDVEIKLFTSYVAADGKMMDNAEVGKFTLNLRDMPMNPTDKGYTEYYNKLIGQQLSGYSFIIPRSYGYSLDEDGNLVPAWSQGNFRIEVSVKEAGKEKFIKTILAENSTEIIKQGSDQMIKLMENKK